MKGSLLPLGQALSLYSGHCSFPTGKYSLYLSLSLHSTDAPIAHMLTCPILALRVLLILFITVGLNVVFGVEEMS